MGFQDLPYKIFVLSLVILAASIVGDIMQKNRHQDKWS